MTAICPAGGPSQAKLGFGLAVTVSSTALAARYANTANWLSAAIASSIAGVAYELLTFCSSDPPAEPTITGPDLVALQNYFDPEARYQAQLKLQQWLAHHLWWEFCECTGGGTPAPPAIQPPPADLPTHDPPAVFPVPTSQPCRSNTFTSISGSGGNLNRGGFGYPVGIAGSAFLYHLVATPVTAGDTMSATWVIEQKAASGTVLRSDTFTMAANQVLDYIAPFSAGCTETRLNQQEIGGTGHQFITGTRFDLFCDGQYPGAPIQPCCPPDPALSGRIDQILAMVTLLQRQIAPFGYVPGVAHAGLTGHGSFAVQGIIGIKIHLSTTNLSGGLRDGSPQELFDQGFVTLGTADGYEHSVRVDHQDQLVLPIAAGAFTAVGYTLEVGVVATITELRREP